MNAMLKRSISSILSVCAAAGVLALSSAASVKSAPIITCTSAGNPPITLMIDTRRKFNKTLSCIKGDFVADMEPCAPNGGWGVSYPTGLANLSGVVMRWQDYQDHLGGVTGYYSDASVMNFEGGFSSGDVGKPWSDKWTFNVNRLTGSATLKLEGKPDVAYACTKASQKF